MNKQTLQEKELFRVSFEYAPNAFEYITVETYYSWQARILAYQIFKEKYSGKPSIAKQIRLL